MWGFRWPKHEVGGWGNKVGGGMVQRGGCFGSVSFILYMCIAGSCLHFIFI